MQRVVSWGRRLAPCLLVLTLVNAAWAEKPEWAGNGRGRGGEARADDRHDDRREDRRDDRYGDRREPHAQAPRTGSVAVDIRIGGYFGEPQRVAAHDYYRQQYRSGSCPPGLAKKNNGCQPPGQAKKYTVGQPLPADVVWYPVPPVLVQRLPVLPTNHAYVRVGGDVLILNRSTRLVVDVAAAFPL